MWFVSDIPYRRPNLTYDYDSSYSMVYDADLS